MMMMMMMPIAKRSRSIEQGEYIQDSMREERRKIEKQTRKYSYLENQLLPFDVGSICLPE